MPCCSILLEFSQLRFQRILEHPLLIPSLPFNFTLYLFDHLRKEQWKCAKYSGFELLYVLDHPYLRICGSCRVTHESKAATEYDRKA